MSLFDQIKSVLGTVAPSLATALGGPLAGQATSFICGALGLDDGASDDDIAARVKSATPAELLALKTADNEFKVKMRELDIDLERIAQADRASARQREVDVKDHVPAILATAITLGFFALIGALIFVEIPVGNKDVVNILTGVLGTAFTGGVVGYYFGMSNTKPVAIQAK